MRACRRAIEPALAVLALAAALGAQQRAPLLGTVVDANGAPLAGATVQLAHVPAGREAETAADHATVTADERGRFRADVWPCTTYRAWAIGPARDGARAVSGVAWVAAGGVVELRADTAVRPAKLAVDGLAAWAHRGPFRVRFLPECTELPALVADVVDGEAEVPALPTGSTLYELLDRDGRVLHATRRNTSARPPWPLDVPPRQRVPLVVADENGAPVADADVRLALDQGTSDGNGLLPGPCPRTTWSTLGRTDAAGTFVAEIAAQRSPLTKGSSDALLVLAAKPDRAVSGSGVTYGRRFCDWRPPANQSVEELRFTLRPAKPLRGRVVAGERPLRGAAVTVRLRARIDLGRSSMSSPPLVWRTTTDAAGRFTIDDAPLDPMRCELAIDADTAALAPHPLPRHTPPRALLCRELAKWPDGEHTIDVAAFVPTVLRVLAADNSPPRHAEVLFVPEGPDVPSVDGFTPRGVPDSAGRLHVLLEPGAWAVFARDETCMATAQAGRPDQATITLALAPMPSLRARCVDEQGNAVSGARAALMMASATTAKHDAMTAFATSMNVAWITRRASDANGNVEVRWLPREGARYQVTFSAGGKESEPTMLEPTADAVTITLR